MRAWLTATWMAVMLMAGAFSLVQAAKLGGGIPLLIVVFLFTIYVFKKMAE